MRSELNVIMENLIPICLQDIIQLITILEICLIASPYILPSLNNMQQKSNNVGHR